MSRAARRAQALRRYAELGGGLAGRAGALAEAEVADAAELAALDELLRAQATGRKRLGAFYTPPAAVDAIVAVTLAPLLDQATRQAESRWASGEREPLRLREPFTALRILDPAAGAGLFLAAAGEAVVAALLASPAGRQTPREAAAAEVAAACLCGVDADPLAPEVAARALGLALGRPGRVVWGDSLAGARFDEPLPEDEPADVPPCHFAQVFPDTTAGFDAVLSNPPYLSPKRGHRPAPRWQRFRLLRGQWDSYMLFVEQGLGLLRPGGRLGYVLPRPALVNEHAEPLRELLLEAGSIDEVIDLGRRFRAGVETAAVVVTRAGEGERVRLGRLTGGAVQVQASLPLAAVRQARRRRLPLGLDEADLAVLARLEAAPARLGDVATVQRGLEIGKQHPGVVDAPGPGRVPLLRGEDVTAFAAVPRVWLAPATVERRLAKSPGLFRPGQLLVRRVAPRPIAALDAQGCWTLNTLYVVHPRADVDPAWLVAVLNAEATAWWYRKALGGDEALFPYLRQTQLLELPLPPVTAEVAELGRALLSRPGGPLATELDRAVWRAFELDSP